MTTQQREQALHTALGQIDKQFGKGSVLRLGSGDVQPIDVIPTGSIALDSALGVGGLPRGRVVEIYGPESSGKTTLALQAVAQSQKEGGTAAFIDAEHAMDPTYARRLGVDLDGLLVSQPDHGEQALEITAALVSSQAVDIIVVDSVAALVPKAELEGEMGDSFMGLHARLMSQALRKLTGAVSRTNTCLIFINQIREKIGVVFGNPETTTGGRALKFYCSIRLDVRRIGAVKEGETVVGSRTKVKVVKNKVAPPFREVELELIHGEGISLENELLELGAQKGLVDKSGSWYSRRGERMGQGREAARQYLREHRDVAAALEVELRAAYGLTGGKASHGTAAGPGDGKPPLLALAERTSEKPAEVSAKRAQTA
ncbi:MAG: recombinase RecA [Bryobacteraceae bacterium]